MSDRHTALTALLRSLRLTTMAEQFDAVAVRAAREGLSHTAFLEELVQQEADARARRREARRVQESRLPREKTLTRLDLTPFSPLIRQQIAQVQTGEFVTQAMNVVVVGKPGAGKSHLCAAIGHALITQGHSVRWYPTATLVQQLLAAKRDLRLPQELAKLHRIDCLILDDIGYVQHDRDEMEVLFTLLADRYERRSMMLTTNLVFSEWTRIFKDPLTTLAAIDRVVHHAVVIDMLAVESYRAKEAQARQQARRAEQDGAPTDGAAGAAAELVNRTNDANDG
jgi:DNA replication protein DnaC